MGIALNNNELAITSDLLSALIRGSLKIAILMSIMLMPACSSLHKTGSEQGYRKTIANPQPVMRQQAVERPQVVERQQTVERPQPVAADKPPVRDNSVPQKHKHNIEED